MRNGQELPLGQFVAMAILLTEAITIGLTWLLSLVWMIWLAIVAWRLPEAESHARSM